MVKRTCVTSKCKPLACVARGCVAIHVHAQSSTNVKQMSVLIDLVLKGAIPYREHQQKRLQIAAPQQSCRVPS